MSNKSGTGKSNFVSEDLSEFKTKSQYVKESPKAAIQENNKKRKISDSQSVDTPQRVRETFMKQIESRQQCTDLMVNNLSNILTELDEDYETMKQNQKKFEHLTGALLKSIQKSNAANKQKLKSLRKIHDTFKKGCEELNSIQKEQTEKLTEDVEHDLETFEQKVIAETKRNGWATLRETFFHAMQNDL